MNTRYNSLILLTLLTTFRTASAQSQNQNCDGVPAVPVTCAAFQSKLAIPSNFSDTQCYRITDELCELSIPTVAASRNHTYPGLFFNQLALTPVDRTWNGNLTFKKLVGESLAFNNLRVTGALRVLAGRVNRFDSARSYLNTIALESAFAVPTPDRQLYNARKSFGLAPLTVNSNLQDSYLNVTKATTLSLSSVNLSNSRINASADLSAMTFQNVRLNGFTLDGEGTFVPPRFQRGTQALTINLQQFQALTMRRMEQTDLDLFKTGTGIDLRGFSMADKDLHGFDFKKASLDRVDFTGADLRGADFRGATGFSTNGPIFRDTKLAGAKFCLNELKILAQNFGTQQTEAQLSLLEAEVSNSECPAATPGNPIKLISSLRNSILNDEKAGQSESLSRTVRSIWSKGLVTRILYGDTLYGTVSPAEQTRNPELLSILAKYWGLPTTGGEREQLLNNLCTQWDGRSQLAAPVQDLLVQTLPYTGIGTMSLLDQLRFAKTLASTTDAAGELTTWKAALAYDGPCSQRPSRLSIATYLRIQYLKHHLSATSSRNSPPLLASFTKAPLAVRDELLQELQADMLIQAAVLDDVAFRLTSQRLSLMTQDDLSAYASTLNQTWKSWAGSESEADLSIWNGLILRLSNFQEAAEIKRSSQTFFAQNPRTSVVAHPYEAAVSGSLRNNFGGAAAIVSIQSQRKSFQSSTRIQLRFDFLKMLAALTTRFVGPEAFLESTADRLGLASPYYAAHKLNALSEVSFSESNAVPELVIAGLFLQQELIQETLAGQNSQTTIQNDWAIWESDWMTQTSSDSPLAAYREQVSGVAMFSEFYIIAHWWDQLSAVTSALNAKTLLKPNGGILLRPYTVNGQDFSYSYSHAYALASYIPMVNSSNNPGMKQPLIFAEEQRELPYLHGHRQLSRTRAALLTPKILTRPEVAREYLSLVTLDSVSADAIQSAMIQSWDLPFESLSGNSTLLEAASQMKAKFPVYTFGRLGVKTEDDWNALEKAFETIEADPSLPAGSDVGNFNKLYSSAFSALASMTIF